MFAQQDRDYIVDEMIKSLATADKPRALLTSSFQGTQFPLLLEEGGFREMVISAVNICIADGWKHNPLWMELLIDTFNLRTANSKIRDIWEKASQQPPATISDLELTVLNNTTPFVNRKSLRLQLTQLEAPVSGRARPILVVNGDPKSGKSYSTHFIDHFCNLKPDMVSYPISIEPGQELDKGAEEIARDLLFIMGAEVNDLPKPDTNMKRYAEMVAKFVLNAATKTKYSQHWFILDNFSNKNLRQDARDFIIAFSDAITKGVLSTKCRLIIIGFEPGTLTVDPGKVNLETVQGCTAADVEFTINEILLRAPAILSPAGLTAIKDFVGKDLPVPPEKMSALNIRLRLLIQAVTGVADIIAGAQGINYEEVLLQMLDELLPEPLPADELRNRLKILEQSIQDIKTV